MSDIRDNLRIYLKRNGYSQSAVARLCGVNATTFNQVCTKKMRLSADLLFKVCDVLSITPDQLRQYDAEGKTA